MEEQKTKTNRADAPLNNRDESVNREGVPSNGVGVPANSTEENSEQEIDLIALAKRLWEKRKFIIKVTACFMALGLLVALFSPKVFTSSCLIVPQSGSKTSGGGLSSLAAMAGISLGDMGGGETISPKLYDKVLNNINFQKDLIYTPIHFEKFQEPVTLIDYYTNKKYQKVSFIGAVKKYTIGLPFTILTAIKGEPKEQPLLGGTSDSTKLQRLTKAEDKAVEIVSKSVSISVNDKAGYISITSNMPEAYAAAQVGQRVLELLQKYVTEFKIQKAKAQYDFIKGRYNEAKATYDTLQEAYAHYQDGNRTLTSAVAQVRGSQLKSKYDLANSLFSELSKQLMQAEIKVKEDTPVFTIVEPIEVPTQKSKPKRASILIMWTFLGGILGCGAVLGLDWMKNQGFEWPKEWN